MEKDLRSLEEVFAALPKPVVPEKFVGFSAKINREAADAIMLDYLKRVEARVS